LARDGRDCRLIPAAMMVDHHAGSAYAVLPFAAECPLAGTLTLRYRLLFDVDPSHRGLLTIVAAGDRVSSDGLTTERAAVVLGLAVALGSFNLGVEAGQIALALLLVPIAFLLRHESAYRRVVAPAVSVASLLLAGAWLVDRVFALDILAFQPLPLAATAR